MDGGDGVHDDVRFLTGSPQRGAVLRALCDEPARPTDLAERVDATRTTIQRILAGFRDRGWVQKRDGRYHPSLTGRRVNERFEALRREVETARDLRPVAEKLDRFGEDLPTEVLAGEDITIATDRSPYAPLDRFIEWVGECEGDRVRVAAPIVAKTLERFAGGALPDGTALELIVDEGAVDDLASSCERARGGDDAVDVYVTSEELEAGLAVCDARVTLGVPGGGNPLYGLVESTHPAVVEWCRTRFEELRATAVRLEELDA